MKGVTIMSSPTRTAPTSSKKVKIQNLLYIAKPRQTKKSEAKPSDAKPSQAKRNQAKPSQISKNSLGYQLTRL